MQSLYVLVVLIGASSAQNGFPAFTASEVNSLLSDTSYVRDQINCVLGRARCDNLGNQLKLAIPEVLGRNCRSCDEQQKRNSRKVTDFIRSNFPGEFAQILRRYRIH